MVPSFHGFNSKLLFGSRSSNSSGSTTPKANQQSHSASSSQTIKPLKRDSYDPVAKASVEVEVEVETDEPSSPPTSPHTWISSLHGAIEGFSQTVEHYLSSPEEDSDEESPTISAALEDKESKAPTQTAGKISRTDPSYPYSDAYQEIQKKIGRIHKFRNVPPEAKQVPHHLWNISEDELPPRFNPIGKKKNK